MEINFNVNDFNISYEPLSELVGGSINHIIARFNFTGSIWDQNTIKTAIFKCNDNSCSVILNDDACIVPTEALQGRSFKVGVCGSFIDGDRHQTVYTNNIMVETGLSCMDYRYDNGLCKEQYEQIMEHINRLYNINNDPESAVNDFNEILEALENKLEKVKVNGVEQAVTDKSVDIAVPTKTSDLQNDSGYITANRYTNIVVSTNDFVEDSTFEDYPYKADILIDGVTVNDYANVIPTLADAQSKNYAPVCTTDEGIISIYAVKVPSSDITIPLIEVVKV